MELELRDYARIIKKRIGLIIALVVVLAATTAVISYWFLEPVYESSTKLIVNNSREMTQSLDLNSVNLDIRLVDTYKQIIKTTAITDKVAARHPELGLSGDDIIKLLNVSSVSNTQVLTIAVRHSDYATTVLLVNEVANVFVEEIPTIMTVNNVSILNAAKLVENPIPIQPNPKLNIAISIVIALMLGVGLALLLEYLDDSIKDEHDVHRYLDLPVLMIIPKMTAEDLQLGKAKRTIATRAEARHNVTITK